MRDASSCIVSRLEILLSGMANSRKAYADLQKRLMGNKLPSCRKYEPRALNFVEMALKVVEVEEK